MVHEHVISVVRFGTWMGGGVRGYLRISRRRTTSPLTEKTGMMKLSRCDKELPFTHCSAEPTP